MSNRAIHQKPPRFLDGFTQATIVFGGMLQQFGWSFFCFGMIFSWIFVAQSEWIYFLQENIQWEEKMGQVESVKETSMSENEAKVYRYTHTYVFEAREYVGTSYTTGKKFDPGQQVKVRFNPDKPEQSYIIGNRRAPFGWPVIFVLLFPLVGLGFILYGLLRSIRFLRVLKIGKFSLGKLVKKEGTNGSVTINDQRYPIFDYTFAFEHDQQTLNAHCRTHRADLVEDEEREIILFDPLRPAYNLVYDAVPNAPVIDAEGYMQRANARKSWVLILPGLTAVINIIGYLIVFG